MNVTGMVDCDSNPRQIYKGEAGQLPLGTHFGPPIEVVADPA